MKKATPYPLLTRSLAVLPNESALEHLTRVGNEARAPAKIDRHQDATTEPTAAAEISPAELAALERASEAKGREALLKLRPKVHPKKVRRVK